MRVRKMDANGDYTIGQGPINFWGNVTYLVAQLIDTRLGLWEGEWFLDLTAGTPYKEEILGYGTTSLRDIALKAVILGTPGVNSIVTYNGVANPATRGYTVSGSVMTPFSTQPVAFGPVNL
jgi:hypothetical protein